MRLVTALLLLVTVAPNAPSSPRVPNGACADPLVAVRVVEA